ncbi:hypothetical protein BDA96_10G324300 [Sorghum bicolor]|uniref:Uncharacterized protein n=1 Tax=Sorghum bicolor TaxID=4558 RepID=A0A921U271_SORBI|nr:hypothetical protein BDA96_10G324300 [Sorghum bicolor]
MECSSAQDAKTSVCLCCVFSSQPFHLSLACSQDSSVLCPPPPHRLDLPQLHRNPDESRACSCFPVVLRGRRELPVVRSSPSTSPPRSSALPAAGSLVLDWIGAAWSRQWSSIYPD